MAIKQQVLAELERHKGEYISGEKLAERLGASRAAVWKSIQSLMEDGYEIASQPRKGYCLSLRSDKLSAEAIMPMVEEDGVQVLVYEELDSSNLEAKRLAAGGAPHGTVVIAGRQTAGRGRLGRSFASPQGGGLYMSILLRPHLAASLAVDVTTLAGVAVCETLEKLTGKKPGIKWVNDIFLNGKKICGILTEAVTDVETGMIDSLVLGIGINVTTPIEELPEEVRKVAGSVFEGEEPSASRAQIAAGIIHEVMSRQETLGKHVHMDEYRARCFILGQRVTFLRDERHYEGVAETILDDGALQVRLDSGEIMILQSGEVSVRPC